ncbi:beta-arrestin-1-like isoform X2 [Amphiura filiformis]|uniref:beta-arrestin-1-like isoform X2 n=1 Tax=Amphiura filiformis TaxID=82378 RepID=UPI003B20B93D
MHHLIRKPKRIIACWALAHHEKKIKSRERKIIKQHERDLLAEKAAAMVARAEREHQAVLEKAAQIPAKAAQDLKAKEERDATLRSLQERKKAEDEWDKIEEEKTKAEEKKKEEDERPQSPAPRVFKKSSPNGKITTYLGKRDFIDHLQSIDDQGNTVDLIDGVVLVDPEYLKGRVVICRVLAAFRYGREDLDVLGLTFRKDLLQMKMQVYPPVEDGGTKKLTRLQERLIKKLGKNAYPFSFRLPPGAASSVTLQPAPGDTGKPCGVDYELSTYVTEDADGKPHKRNSVRLAIRKLTYGPSPEEKKGEQPSAEVQHEFTFSPAPLTLEVTLDKEMYYHGETIHVNVQITNNSNKRVKGIKIKVQQIACICLFSQAEYKCPVASVDESIDVPRSSTFCRVYYLTPLLANNRDKRGLALDGQLKNEDTNLASSSILDNVKDKENLGIIVEYRTKVKLVMAGVGVTEPSLELPLKLTHPKPADLEPAAQPEVKAENPVTEEQQPQQQQQQQEQQPEAVDANLISFDTSRSSVTPAVSDLNHSSPSQQKELEHEDDDLVFEDFARMRLKGYDGEDTQA